MKLTRLSVVAMLALLALPAAASAQPQIDPETDGGNPFYAVLGKDFGYNSALMDESVCADDSYDDDTGDLIDPKGNDYNMVGIAAVLQQQPQTGGEWVEVARKTISRDDIEVNCEEGEGAAYAEVEFAAKPVEVRSNYRVTFSGGVDNVNLTSKNNLMFPRFEEGFRWKNAKNGRSVSVVINGDPKLIGMKAFFYLTVNPSKSFKLTQRLTVGKKGSKSYLKVNQKLPAKAKKKGWRGYMCLNYQAKYPLMSTGNACPNKTVSASTLEELFPYSTRGGY